jgi:OOP family OmpA-OmpF porin
LNNTNIKGGFMSIRKNSIAALLAAAGMAISSASMAQAKPAETGFYAGASFGQSEADGSCPAGFSCDFKDTEWKIFGGYRINRNFAAEVFYANHGEISVKVGGASATAESSTFGIAALGILPLGGNFELFGKLGIGSTSVDATATAGGLSAGASDSGSDLLFGVGAVYNFNRNLGVRAEYEHYNDSEINVLSIGVQYRF